MGNAPERIWFTKVDNNIVPNSKRTRPEDVKYVRADLTAPSWQPIETAPKDGTEIQGWIVRREDGVSGKKEYWEPRIRWVGVWEYMHPHGWFELSMLPWVTKSPTHWMPLPAPPEAD